MVNLLMKAGVAGIGIYWCIVEMLYEEGGYLMLSECDRIAFELRTDSELVQSVIDSTLFEKDSEKFWSQSVLRRIEKRNEKSAKTRESALLRWNNANALRAQSESNAIKGKESKGKESKNKESVSSAVIVPPPETPTSSTVSSDNETYAVNSGRFEYDESAELPATYLESAEMNQYTLHKSKNTEFLMGQWKVFLHEKKKAGAYYPSLAKLADHFVNWVRPKYPPRNGSQVKAKTSHYHNEASHDFFNTLTD
jgi:hypothetical protein